MYSFDAHDHSELAGLFSGFTRYDGATHTWPQTPFAGYRPNVVEVPNGDGKPDEQKRYLHVAQKYLAKHPGLEWPREFLARAHYIALDIAERIGVPSAFYPRIADSTLRVLEYPAGAGTEEHHDFDLFTVNLWRSTPEDHEQRDFDVHAGPGGWSCGAPEFHVGEIGALVGLGPSVLHRVPARPYKQAALVYFAMPDHLATLPERNGQTVGEWLKNRYASSRVYK